jgi:hypothetical protein
MFFSFPINSAAITENVAKKGELDNDVPTVIAGLVQKIEARNHAQNPVEERILDWQ